jgi:hypothetical protein
MAVSGIDRLIAVTQMKANNANDNAMAGADKQRQLLKQQEQLRAAQRKFEDYDERQRAYLELRQRLQILRQSLSPAAAAMLDQWLEWAAQHH